MRRFAIKVSLLLPKPTPILHLYPPTTYLRSSYYYLPITWSQHHLPAISLYNVFSCRRICLKRILHQAIFLLPSYRCLHVFKYKKSGLSTTSTSVIMNEASSHKNLKLYITITSPVDTQPTKAAIHIKNSPDCAQSHTNDTLRLLRISWLIHKKAQFLPADTQESSVYTGTTY